MEMSVSEISPQSKSSKIAIRKLIAICIVCSIFMLIEVVGGYLAHSLAIITDAAHLFSDLVSFVISILAIWLGQRTSNSKFNFGFKRAEVLGALASVIMIWILTAFLIKEAIDRLILREKIQANIMLTTSIFGLICNLIMIKILHSNDSGISHAGCDHHHEGNHNENKKHKHSHHKENHKNKHKHHKNGKKDHSHEHIHNHDEKSHENKEKKESPEQLFNASIIDLKLPELTNNFQEDHPITTQVFKDTELKEINEIVPNENFIEVGTGSTDECISHHHNHHEKIVKSEHEENVNVKAAMIHIIGDIIQSVGVVCASVIIYYFPKLDIVDPICTFLFSIIVFFTTINITKRCVLVLMEASPAEFDKEKIEKLILEKFQEIEKIIDFKTWSISSGKNYMSLVILSENKELLTKIYKFLFKRYNLEEVYIQIESKEESDILINIKEEFNH